MTTPLGRATLRVVTSASDIAASAEDTRFAGLSGKNQEQLPYVKKIFRTISAMKANAPKCEIYTIDTYTKYIHLEQFPWSLAYRR